MAHPTGAAWTTAHQIHNMGLTAGYREPQRALKEGVEGKHAIECPPGARHSVGAFCVNASQTQYVDSSPKNVIKMQSLYSLSCNNL